VMDDLRQPVWRMYVNGALLRDDYRHLITNVELVMPLDGATQLIITMAGLTPDDMGFKPMTERLLFPGSVIEFFAGYGEPDHPLGRFDVRSHSVEYGADGVVLTIEAFDRLASFQEHRQARIIQGAETHTDAVVAMLEEDYGDFGYVVDLGQAKAGDRIKRTGTTDLQWLKYCAMADGFAYPRVWTKEQYERIQALALDRLGGDPIAILAQGALTKVRQDNLVYLPLSTLYGTSEPLRLWYSSPDRGSDWRDLRVSFSTQDIPSAIEAYGITEIGGERKVVKVTAEYTQAGVRIAEKTDSWEDSFAKQEKIRGDVASGSALKLYTLGEGRRTYETGAVGTQRTKSGKLIKWQSERESREILAGTVVRTTEDVIEYVKRWFAQRASAYLVADGTLFQTPGLERVAPSQVHELAGVAPTHGGLYVTLSVKHNWSADDHTATVSLQKLVTEADMAVDRVGPETTSEELL
jgi:hypothetical protein